MKVSAEKLEGNKAKITVEVPEEIFEKYMDKAFRQVVKKITIHGFRQGKAPRHVVERLYGREILLEDAVNDAVPDAFIEALNEVDRLYECISYPHYDVVSSNKGEGLVFTATYDMKPEVKLGFYKGIELERISDLPEEGAVDKQIDAMRERFARLDKSEDPAAVGDICTIDFLGKIGGVAFEGGQSSGYQLELGSSTLIPGFEDQLVGSKTGDEVVVNVTFPEDYSSEELAGKDAVFEVSVKDVQHRILSDLDDDFAKDVSEFDTMEELRKDMEEKLAKEAQDRSQSDFESKAVTKAVENAELELTDDLIGFRQDQLLENFVVSMNRQGIDFQQYLNYLGSTAEEMRENMKERAIQELKTDIVMEAIAATEGIEASEEDIDKQIQRFADQATQSAEEIRKIYDENEKMADSLKSSLIMEKTAKFLADNAKVTKTPGGILLS
ncbi:MAG: trigger factor [Peptococcaceae bacterium]|jgi:trigger factor|nr:trigger factor [Peptococcaceae bacterium]